MAIFLSHDIYPTNADATFPFRQNNDLLYLSGIDQEETALILYTDSDTSFKSILFIRETNEHIAIWEGEKLSKQQAQKLSGIDEIYWIQEFDSIFEKLLPTVKNLYLNSNEHSRADKQILTKEERFLAHAKLTYTQHNIELSAPIMHELRVIKKKEEINQIQQACSITEKAFKRILNFIKPGIYEFEIEAEIAHEFLKNRSLGPAYSSIIASGKDACVLHYVSNNKKCESGDLILMDFGAEYGNYASDLTRTVPVNGKFSPRQKEVYQAVLTILKQSTLLLTPGNTFEAYQKEVNAMVEEQLVNLNLLNMNDIKTQDPKKPLFRKYFMHGISHYMGLDVHDVGDRTGEMKAGMILTCEPGIYIPEEGLGVRLENDILIGENGPINLMEAIPIEAEEIEYLMSKK